MLWIPVDQVNLLGVDIMESLFVDAVVVHFFIVGFVNVALFPDERRVRVFLRFQRKHTMKSS